MLNLFLAILSSTMVSVLMRLGDRHVKNTMVLFFANYTVCCLTSLFLMGRQPIFPGGEGFGYTLGLGLIGGGLFLGSFALMRLNIQKNGVVLTSIFMKLGVLVPMGMAVIFFHEIPGITQILGFIIAAAAIVILNAEPNAAGSAIPRGMILLLLLLLLGGLADSFVNIYDKTGNPDWKDHFLLYIFASAGMLCLIPALIRREPVSPADVLFGLIIGIPNYFSTRFLMMALSSVPAIVAYPVYNVATIVLISLVGVIAFREHLSKRKAVGIGMILAALVLLNI